MNYKIASVFVLLLFVDSLDAAGESMATLDSMPAGYLISQMSTVYPAQAHSGKEITAQDESPTGAEDDHPYIFSMGQHRRGVFSPGALLYPPYIANPIRPMIALNVTGVNDNDIAAAGDSRYVFRLGGRVGFFRMHPKGSFDRGFQLDLEGAFLGIFDVDNSLDNIGWDGVYGALFTWSSGSGLAAKLAIQHDSSHVGDEYIERTGRGRINYTRQEYAFGLSLSGLKYWRVYGEAGWAFDMRNEELQEEWRLEGGLEFEDPDRFWNGKAGYYAAVDIMSYEESDWKTDVTVQAGLVLPKSQIPRIWRIGLEYRKGRSVIGEFFQNRESHIAFGLWLDL
jgi:hypothetical protein